MVARMRRRERRASSRAQQPGPSGSARIIIEFNRYRGLMSSASVMKGLKPFEDTIYIDSVPVIEYGWIFVQYKVVEQKKIHICLVLFSRQNGIFGSCEYISFSKIMGANAYF